MDFKEHFKSVVEQSKWGPSKQLVMQNQSISESWDRNIEKEVTAFREHLDNWNRAINLDYYNRFGLLFDADFRTKMDYPNSLEHGWKQNVTVGMMQFLYNATKDGE